VRRLLRRIEGGIYARLTAIPSDLYVDMESAHANMGPEFEGLQRHFSNAGN
jgi:hypothetical protein